MPVVYTRNIVQPEYGLTFSHTGKKISTGALWIQDEATELIMPDSLGDEKVEIDALRGDLFAARYVTGEKGSATGLMLTGRTAEDYYNYVAGIDGLINFGIDDKLRYQLMYSSTEYPDEFAEDLCDGDNCLQPPPEDCPLGDCDYNAAVLRADPKKKYSGHGIRLSYKHDSPKNIYWLNYFDYAAGYRSDFGLDKRTDYRLINAAYGKNWYLQALRQDKGKSRIRAYLVGNHLESSKGETIENGVDLWTEFRGSYQTVFRPGYRVKERAVNRIQQNTLELGDNAPLFDESYWQWYLEVSPVNYFTFNLDGRYGNIADADNLVLGRMQEFKPKISLFYDKLKFQFAHTYRNFDYEGSRLWRENFSTLQLAYHFTSHHGLRLLVLYDQTDIDTTRYLGDEVPYEEEGSFELTYLYNPGTSLSVLAGAKAKQENDSSLEHSFTSDREVYIKLVYDFEKIATF